MTVKTLTLDGRLVSAREDETILQAARESGIDIPTLCYLDGLSAHGGCRLCLVEIAGSSKLQPACTTKILEGMEIRTDTERLRNYRLMIVELLFAEGNHVCAVCVANNHCELQQLAMKLGMDHERFEYLYPKKELDASHDLFGIDHNRCILCTRCVRVCDEVEGAHTWDVSGRGINSQIISDLNQPWGTSTTCTSCGKCFQACPTGAIFRQGSTVAELERNAKTLDFIVKAREKRQWII